MKNIITHAFRRILAISLLISCGYSAFASTSTLASANESYLKKEYKSALEQYTELSVSYTSSGLYYNIANCHYRLDNLGKAILNYERALRLDNSDEEIKTNLQIANQQLTDKIEALPSLGLNYAIAQLYQGKALNNWATASIILCLLSFVFFIGGVLFDQRKHKRSFMALGLFLITATIVATTLAYWAQEKVNKNMQAIVMTEEVAVLTSPKSTDNPAFVLHEGTKVWVLEQVDDWMEIKIANGSVGWLQNSSIEQI